MRISRSGPLDAFVFVTPEYNHGIPAALKNAIGGRNALDQVVAWAER